jgi:ABC-type multidrug transport system fused ATPase/permease subunit
VGPAGSGKSTLADLLFGLRPPTEGRVEIDGCDLRDLDLPLLRNRVAMVKHVEIVEGTLADNVRMGRDLSLWEVRRALEKVGLLDDVSELPGSLHTPLTITGSPLSRGQAQRLMLARAIAGRPRLVVIDQMLDNLSTQSMGTIYSTLFDRQAPWTVIVMTHHPEVIRHCDRTISLPRRSLAHRHHHVGGNGHNGDHAGDVHAPDSNAFEI